MLRKLFCILGVFSLISVKDISAQVQSQAQAQGGSIHVHVEITIGSEKINMEWDVPESGSGQSCEEAEGVWRELRAAVVGLEKQLSSTGVTFVSIEVNSTSSPNCAYSTGLSI